MYVKNTPQFSYLPSHAFHFSDRVLQVSELSCAFFVAQTQVNSPCSVPSRKWNLNACSDVPTFKTLHFEYRNKTLHRKKSFYKKSFLFIWHLISHWCSGVRVGAALATAQWELRGSCVSWKWHRAICYKTPFSDVKSTWHVYTEMRDYAKVFFRSEGQWSRSKTFSIWEWHFYFLRDIYPSLDH